jgi:hypothetical protein
MKKRARIDVLGSGTKEAEPEHKKLKISDRS